MTLNLHLINFLFIEHKWGKSPTVNQKMKNQRNAFSILGGFSVIEIIIPQFRDS